MKAPHLRSIALQLLACAVALTFAGCRTAPGKPGPEPETPRPEHVLDFARLYGQNCAACHGANGKNGAAISLANPVYLAIAGAANIQRVTAAGVPGTSMPPFARSKGGMLTDQQIHALTNGMIQNWGVILLARLVNPNAPDEDPWPPYAAKAPGNTASGQKAFATYCARCHGAGGTGGISPGHAPETSNVIPSGLANEASAPVVTGSLVDPSYLALVTDQGLRSWILAGQTEQGSHDWQSYSPDHELSDQEVTDIVAWLASHRTATPGQVYKQHP
jgi:mono/diheme cytochrome c family protein